MTKLWIPPFEQQEKLLQTVTDELSAKHVDGWLQLCLGHVQEMSKNTNDMHRALEQVLADGVEARSFARSYSQFLPRTHDYLVRLRKLIERVSSVKDPASETLAAELSLLEGKTQIFRDLLAGALDRASQAPRPVDWERARAAEEAHARGETKLFSQR